MDQAIPSTSYTSTPAHARRLSSAMRIDARPSPESSIRGPPHHRDNPPRRSSRRPRPAAASPSLFANTLRSVLFAALVVLSLCSTSALASQGDRSLEYKQCVNACVADVCGPLREEYMAKDGDGTVIPLKIPLILRATFWSCPDDCAYHCTHRVTNDAFRKVKDVKAAAKRDVWARVQADVKNGGRGASRKEINERINAQVKSTLDGLLPVQKQMVQFYGKWVFIRVLGMQEPLSVLFSILNLIVHVRYLPQLRKRVPDVFPLKMVYIAHALVSANAWVWSAVFHARDKSLTEKLDYFSAGAAILSGFFFTIARLFRLAPGDARFTLMLRISAAALVLHILYLSLSARFDYSYNMTVNVVLALGHNLLWLAYSFAPSLFPDGSSDRHRMTRAALRAHKPASGFSTPNGGSPPAPVLQKTTLPSTSRKARKQLRLIVLLLTLAASLELLDFPPLLRALDAHALWHLSTVPIAAMWYEWIIEDSQECVSSGFWIGGGPAHESLLMASPVVQSIQRAASWAKDTAAPIGANIQRRSRASGVELAHLTESLSSLANKAGLSAAGAHSTGSSSTTSGINGSAAAAGSSGGGGGGNTVEGSHERAGAREKLSDELEERIGV